MAADLSTDLQIWILVVPVAASFATWTINLWQKISAESRERASAALDAEIRLLKHFTDLMTVANARSGYHFSDLAYEHALSRVRFLNLAPEKEHEYLAYHSIMILPVGEAAQNAAIAAISDLAIRHKVLREPGISALKALAQFTKCGVHYLDLTLQTVGARAK